MGPRRVVVLDTNVLVSALGWRGPEHRLYRMCGSGRLQMVTSPQLLAEVQRVLCYPKFEFADEEIDRFLDEVRSHAQVVLPSERIEIIENDPAASGT